MTGANMSVPVSFSAADHDFMAKALRLAGRGLWTTSPNPRVGCVIVVDGIVRGEGWHQRAGGPHAEIHALQAAGDLAQGATVYVTLEPCSHHGRTPPCCDALIAAGVRRVVVAMSDPNPLVSGAGLAALRAAGVDVASGLMEVAATELNRGFVSRMTRGRPWVRVKLAASLDGRTALSSGESQWITGVDARRDGHRWRARACAILTGSGTVLRDDPLLTVRECETQRQPLRVVIDGAARIPPSARIFSEGEVLWVTAREGKTPASNVERLCLPGREGHVDLEALLYELGRRGINELHVEAGPRLAGGLLHQGLVDELLFYFAPCLIGDSGKGLFALPGLASLADKTTLNITDLRVVGGDIRVLARVG